MQKERGHAATVYVEGVQQINKKQKHLMKKGMQGRGHGRNQHLDKKKIPTRTPKANR
jgi:hypothetical protein